MQVEELIAKIADNDPSSSKGRVDLLTTLYAMGFPTQRTQDAPTGAVPHTVLVWIAGHPSPEADVYAIPDGAISEKVDEALDAANGLVVRSPLDCSVYQLASMLRVLNATGQVPPEALLERVSETRDEIGPDADLVHMPGKDEVKETHGALREHLVGTLGGAVAPDPSALDVEITRSVGIADLIR